MLLFGSFFAITLVRAVVWTELLPFTTPNAGERYGYAISIADVQSQINPNKKGLVVVGKFNTNPTSNRVFLTERTGASWSSQTSSVVPGESVQPDDEFGKFVAAAQDNSDIFVVGAPKWDETGKLDVGRAYVFERSAVFWTQAKLYAPAELHESSYFGAVDIDRMGNRIVVGAYNYLDSDPPCPYPDPNGNLCDRGIVYVFEKIGGSWQKTATLEPFDRYECPDLSSEGVPLWFGAEPTISPDGRVIFVGAMHDDYDVNGNCVYNPGQGDKLNAGSVYVFEWDDSTSSWVNRGKFWNAPADIGSNKVFGRHIASDFTGSTVVVEAPFTDEAYIVERSGNTWSQTYKEVFPESNCGPWWQLHECRHGKNVAISDTGDKVYIGAARYDNSPSTQDSGAVYEMVWNGGWNTPTLIEPDNPVADDQFGFSVDYGQGSLVAGSPYADVGGNVNAGRAFVK